jgi:O-succinylbenzoate synthase
MQVNSVELFRVSMPMKAAWRTAFSEMSAIDSVFVRLDLDGAVGWAESAPYSAPNYCAEWADGAFDVLRDWLAPALVGKRVSDGGTVQALLKPFKGNEFAKSALDIAWWDASARLDGKPLWQAIGGQSPTVTVGADISVQDDTDVLIGEVGRALEAGFARVKLKFRPGMGAETIQELRQRFPDAVMHIDCNSGFTLHDLPLFRELDRCGLAMIEQPLAHDDLIDHARLQRELQTPLCLDESIVSLDKARKAIEIDAGAWINLKVGRVGGLTNAIAIHDLCQDHNVPCWVGGMLESGVGQGPSLALATLPNIKYPNDIFPSARFYNQDVSEPAITLSGTSMVTAPSGSGHGFAPDPERLRQSTIRHTRVMARTTGMQPA